MSGKTKKNKGLGTTPRKNKNGIPVFDRGEDLFSLFKKMPEAAPEEGERKSSVTQAGAMAPGRKKRGKRNNKHGLPVLDGSGSLARMFAARGRSQEEETEDFPSMLSASLGGKGEGALLREKREKDRPDPMPLHKRLKRYPPPESELDLHGDTAVRAVVRSELFIRNAWRAGGFTVRIVVGKGLHSEFGAVLPDVVEDLLVKLKKEGVVLSFEWDRKLKTRSGSVIVYLKQF
ncbi:MAG: Smr/MutS family protein [Desulfobacteraceae bacterium]|nr:Smr/MutS family protein [Desulfobacteraceae bacterium]